MRRFVSLLFILIGASCNSDGKKETALLQKASGKPGEMIVVMDSSQWNGEVGEAIKATFREEIAGLPREEYMFKLNRVEPVKFNSILKTVKNLLFVVTLDKNTPATRIIKQYFTAASLERIRNNEDLFVYTATDQFARGQHVMYLFGNTEGQLITRIEAHKERLQDYFNKVENRRLKEGLYAAKESKSFARLLEEDHGVTIRIPFGYKLVVNEPGFIWFRQINDESDKNIFIAYEDYKSESAFSDEEIIAFRDKVAKKQLFEDPDQPDTFIKTETTVPYIPVVSAAYNFNDKYSKETRGLWKTNNRSMGGPFLGYTMVDEERNRLFYIEGFVYSPGKSQRELMREMEVILNTFRMSSEQKN